MIARIRLIGNQSMHPGSFCKYQSYYVKGFRSIEGVDFDITPFHSRLCASLYDSQIKGAHRLWSFCNNISLKNRSIEADHVGRYVCDMRSKQVKIAIDSADGRAIRDKEAFQWCDIYFKANKWEGVDYPAKVLPIVNGNGNLDNVKLNRIKDLRNQEKKIDLNFMAIVYASSNRDLFFNNIEHHIRLFEALAKLECKKFLKAIIPKQYPIEMMGEYLNRLDRAGVPWSYSWDGMSSEQFWRHLAEAKVVFQRPGKHACISWRMIELLCMGACIAYDLALFPNWPVPLIADRNYIDCGCGLGRDNSLPPIERYNAIIGSIEKLLADDRKMETMREYNRHYFDHHANPQSVANYILNTVRRYDKNPQPSTEFVPMELIA